jgi:uncharacterized protein YceK
MQEMIGLIRSFKPLARAKLLKDMKKIFIYMMMVMIGIVMTGCSAESSNEIKGSLTTKTPNTEQPKDTTKQDTAKWASCDDKTLPIGEDMIAHPAIQWLCTNGTRDTSYMEPWPLEIEVTDLIVRRDSYQPSSRSGKSLDAERSTGEEVKDRYGNLVKRHSYTQPFLFNNFTHSISGAWTTGRVLYGNGKEESYLPEDGLYYDMSYQVSDTVHFVKNDSIFAREDVKIKYTATLKKTAKTTSWQSWTKEATVTVISFIGLVEKEPEIPTAEHYVANLKGHVTSGNRFFKKIGKDKDGDIGYWEDGFLMSSDTHYILLIVHYTVDAKDGKSDERLAGKEIIFVPKSEMITPAKGREYNAVMYDWQRKKYIPCCLSKDHNFSYGSQYADGSPASYQTTANAAIMSGVKNFAKDNDASPSPWLETACAEAQYNGKNYYTITLKSSVHTNVTTVADSSLKK